jgi:hypothetical protein
MDAAELSMTKPVASPYSRQPIARIDILPYRFPFHPIEANLVQSRFTRVRLCQRYYEQLMKCCT